MKYSQTNPPITCMMTHSTWYNGAVENSKPLGILWHDTAAGNPDIKRYVQPYVGDADYAEMMELLGKNKYGNDWNHNAVNKGVNAFVGKLADGTVTSVQVGEWTMAPWGCGSGTKGSCNGYVPAGNNTVRWVKKHWIQFEICDDGYKSRAYFEQVYKEACELTAYLCKLYDIDPNSTVTFNGVKVPTILCHADSHKLQLGSDHSDVLKWFKKMGKTMDDVRKDVSALLAQPEPEPEPKPEPEPEPQPQVLYKKGDLVQIIGTTYYSGKSIPAWVLKKNWYVYCTPKNPDRVVLDESEDGKSHIMSPVHAYDLKLIKAAPDTSTIEVGDVVAITSTTYYSGKTIPAWVLKENWIVKSAPAGSDRIVLGKSENGKHTLNTPVNRKDLRIVSKAK